MRFPRWALRFGVGMSVMLALGAALGPVVVGSGEAEAMRLPSGPATVPGPVVGARQPPTPPPPFPRRVVNPVVAFRELLEADPGKRERMLATRSENHRQYLRERLRDFDAMSPADREINLRLLELRAYLLPLMRMEPAARGEGLARIPEEQRSLVEERLREWDQLPAAQQAELLENQEAARFFPRFEAASGLRRETEWGALPPERRQQLERDLRQWRDLPESQRARITANFQRFFALTPAQRIRTLERLEATVRGPMEQALAALAGLPAEDRAKCLEGLSRFAHLPESEQARFLENAVRWRSMTPEQREAWRKLISRLPPPPPPPPLPRRPNAAGGGPAQAAR